MFRLKQAEKKAKHDAEWEIMPCPPNVDSMMDFIYQKSVEFGANAIKQSAEDSVTVYTYLVYDWCGLNKGTQFHLLQGLEHRLNKHFNPFRVRVEGFDRIIVTVSW